MSPDHIREILMEMVEWVMKEEEGVEDSLLDDQAFIAKMEDLIHAEKFYEWLNDRFYQLTLQDQESESEVQDEVLPVVEGEVIITPIRKTKLTNQDKKAIEIREFFADHILTVEKIPEIPERIEKLLKEQIKEFKKDENPNFRTHPETV